LEEGAGEVFKGNTMKKLHIEIAGFDLYCDDSADVFRIRAEFNKLLAKRKAPIINNPFGDLLNPKP